MGPSYKGPPSVGTPRTPPAVADSATATIPTPDAWWQLLGDPLLTSLVADALGRNYQLDSAAARLREARARRAAALGGYRPNLNADGTARRREASLNSNPVAAQFPGFERTTNYFEVGFDARWEIDLFGRTRHAVAAADAQVDATRAQLRATGVSIAAEVARTYLELRALQERRQLLEARLAAQEAVLAVVQTRVDAGSAAELDLRRAETRLGGLRGQLPGLRAQERARALALEVLTGRLPGELPRLRVSGDLPAPPTALPYALRGDTVARRPDVRAAERALAAAVAQEGVATAELYPRFSFMGGIGLSSLEAGDLTEAASRFWSLGPSLHLPIFQGGRLRANRDAVHAAAEAAATRFQQTVLSAYAEVETALIAFREARLASEELARATLASARGLEIVQTQYDQGVVALDILLEVESEHNSLRDEHVRARERALTQYVAIFKAIGGGASEVPVPPVKVPAAHEPPVLRAR